MKKGSFIVIEGSDGSGKATHFTILTNWLKEMGHDVATFDFPQYGHESSYFVRQYLNGKYGSAETLGAYGPSLFYALDRFEASFKIREAIQAGKTILCNRYYGSNLAHQGQKINSPEKRKQYYDWLSDMEFNILKIPKPDINIVLLMPAAIAQELIGKKEKRTYTEKSHDLHEADLEHLKRAVATFEELCTLYPHSFTPIHCVTDSEELKTIVTIQEEIRNQLKN